MVGIQATILVTGIVFHNLQAEGLLEDNNCSQKQSAFMLEAIGRLTLNPKP